MPRDNQKTVNLDTVNAAISGSYSVAAEIMDAYGKINPGYAFQSGAYGVKVGGALTGVLELGEIAQGIRDYGWQGGLVQTVGAVGSTGGSLFFGAKFGAWGARYGGPWGGFVGGAFGAIVGGIYSENQLEKVANAYKNFDYNNVQMPFSNTTRTTLPDYTSYGNYRGWLNGYEAAKIGVEAYTQRELGRFFSDYPELASFVGGYSGMPSVEDVDLQSALGAEIVKRDAFLSSF